MNILDLLDEQESTDDVLTIKHLEAVRDLWTPPPSWFDILEEYKANNPFEDISWLEVTG